MTIIHEASFPEQGRMTIDLALLLGRECPMPIHGWAHEPGVQRLRCVEIVQRALFSVRLLGPFLPELSAAVLDSVDWAAMRRLEEDRPYPATPWSTGGEP